MSRVGQKAIAVPKGVTVTAQGQQVCVKGPKGELSRSFPQSISVSAVGEAVRVTRADDLVPTRALHGTARSLIANMITGVSQGFFKVLEIHGVGFRAAVQGQKVVLNVGYSSPVEFPLPQGVTVKVAEGTRVEVSGADRERVGLVAARLRGFFPPEPYKGKGIRYQKEYVRRKAGKTVA